MAVRIEPLACLPHEDWLALRLALWPGSREEHLEEMAQFLREPQRYGQWIAYDGDEPVGLAEAAVRHDYVNGTESSPIVFLEGIYVAPAARRRGIARQLVARIAQWARSQGIGELASDAELHNTTSQTMHRALGFEETERVVFFRMPLG